jgi:integrase/recombinase XerD
MQVFFATLPILQYYTYCRIWGTPHMRHSRSMHMLHAGVNIYYIKEFLGHSDLSTTENFYVKADTEMKRKALEKVSPSAIPPVSENIPCWKQDENLLDWLKSFG